MMMIIIMIMREIKKKKLKRLGKILHQGAIILGEIGEFFERNEAIAIFVDGVHHPLRVLGAHSESVQRVAELRRRDLPVAVRVESLEDPLAFGRVHSIVRHYC